MVIDLLAVYDDGHRPADHRLPADLRKPIALAAGEQCTVRIRLVTRAGTPVRLQQSESLVLVARTIPDPVSEPLFEKTAVRVTTDAPGTYRVTIDTDDTAWRGDVRRAIYDVWYRRAGGQSCVLPTSSLILAAASPPADIPPPPSVP